MAQHDLQELIEYPNERLAAEYKDWLDLVRDIEARANLARHIGAIANFGGGYIVFGFSDALVPTGQNPFDPPKINRDLISSITKKYLEPSMQCDVVNLISEAGNKHVVVVVPAHGAIPVCAKANGPERDGKLRGIIQGQHYIRKTGPESAPIGTAAEWAPLIRRCALHERTAILAALGAALEGPAASPSSIEDELRTWHDAARRVFETDLLASSASPLIGISNVQLSYAIEREDDQRLDPADIRCLARDLNIEIRDRVNTGWSMFFPFDRQPIAAFMNTDPLSGQGEQEFLETDLLRDTGPITDDADMWRLATDGKATLIRPYRLDFLPQPPRAWKPGAWFSPNYLCRELGEIVRHAQALSERFQTPTRVAFRCEWRGLKGRMLADPVSQWSPGRIAHSDNRTVTRIYPVTRLASEWPTIVAELGEPVLRAFASDLRLDANWVERQAAGWRPIGSHYP